MALKNAAPCGSWASPITAEWLASSGVGLGMLQASGSDIYWVESRPLENGRHVVVRRSADSAIEDVTPAEHNARTLVHEYGGGMYLVHGQTVYYSNFDDQRLYRQDRGTAALPITPEPPLPQSLRYADGRTTPDGRHIICVRESHRSAGDVINELVVLPADGSSAPQAIACGYDFYSSPRISPDGSQLAWLCWSHPQMPWDGCELWTAELTDNCELIEERHEAGGASESIFQPEWSPEGVLHFVSDRSDWWNLYRLSSRRSGSNAKPLAPMDAEFGQPQWYFGYSRYVFLPDSRIACIYSTQGFDRLGIIEPGSGSLDLVEWEYTALDWISTAGGLVWAIGSSPTTASAVLSFNPENGSDEVVKRSITVDISSEFFSNPQAIEFATANQRTAHAIYYAPANPDHTCPAGKRPPLIVISHGGPTAASKPRLSFAIQYWTSRGFAVVDVNYGGSTGYGRSYRERLKGQWGVVDVADCAAAALYLVEQGQADASRIAIRGGSAGGYTTLRALACSDIFAAGASYYGVTDLVSLAEDTHKFESRYLDSLIGPYPEQKDLYQKRSPLSVVHSLSCPIILLQGLEDRVVPPSQAEIIIKALKAKNLPYAYLTFEGEQHGFRKAASIQRSAEAELFFYGRVFGFAPSDSIEPVRIENL